MTGPIDPVALTQALVRIPSVTPDAEPALSHLRALLEGLGFSCTSLRFSADGTPDVDNLFARIGDGEPHLAFAGHLDVVPSGPESDWTHPPFAGDIANGKLFGRGATDMKSGVACFAAAVSAFIAERKDPLPGSLSLILTGDEEGPAINGTEKIVGWMRDNGHTPDHCIVGEPASRDTPGDQIKVGRRGSISGTLTAHGRQGHVAYPHLADNPVPLLARMISAIKAEPIDAGTDRFEPTNLEFTQLATNSGANNVIPGTAQARFNIRYTTAQTPNSLKAVLVRRLATVATREQFNLELERPAGEPFLTENETLIGVVGDAIADVTGTRPVLSTGGGTSDARFIKDICPVVEVGLAGRTMHEIDECVPVADIKRQTAIYLRLLHRYFEAGIQ